MLDINYIKEDPAEVIDRLAIKGKDGKEEIEKIPYILCMKKIDKILKKSS